jgi:predicted transcriptional regulator
MTDRVAEFLAKAAAEPAELTVRELLAVWGFRYRDYDSTGRVQTDLRAAGMVCEPPFTEGGMNSVVIVGAPAIAYGPEAFEPAGPTAEDEGATDDEPGTDEQLRLPQVSLRIRDILSATAGIRSVRPDATLEQVQHIMMTNGYSQLAVVTGPAELKGAISWEGIAKARIAKQTLTLSDAIDRYPQVVYADQELLDQLPVIYAAGFVFVKDHNDRLCGIVTNADLTSQFGDMTTPFFQLGEIERRIRPCIDAVFGTEELRRATKKRKLTCADEMTFGEYCLLFDDDERWSRMHWGLDRVMFAEHLDEVRKIRNHIMHFGAKPLDGAQKARLAAFLDVMRYLNPMP